MSEVYRHRIDMNGVITETTLKNTKTKIKEIVGRNIKELLPHNEVQVWINTFFYIAATNSSTFLKYNVAGTPFISFIEYDPHRFEFIVHSSEHDKKKELITKRILQVAAKSYQRLPELNFLKRMEG